ncbi:hypothetical protein SNOG_12500 [Parastagonospora nodorum SN15]|uniref:Uncharacterized protein n=1 Tax=Phaeosphaeria nodorum (strain SN15 / ATCC MYA-4574 / FGSC 10173) TaxID=321614 RepID=Q0U6W4_PHANO|nr:hypothetical protein SNOG_12500 [Parastagonospora nodorum SN15]EAT80313.1 hypothetical protein SNOG_12500 [Parastagonospora nodorum SN15]
MSSRLTSPSPVLHLLLRATPRSLQNLAAAVLSGVWCLANIDKSFRKRL